MDVSYALKQKILDQIIEPYYFDDVQTILKNIRYWSISGTAFETISKLLVMFGAVFSFSSGFFTNYNTALSFTSGTFSSISLACFQFAIYCNRESKKCTIKLNEILNKLQIAPIEIPRDVSALQEDKIQKTVINNDYDIELQINKSNNKNPAQLNDIKISEVLNTKN